MRERTGSGLRPGLHLHRASHTETLARQLLYGLHEQPPQGVLTPQRVVVAHPALGRWLLQVIAQSSEANAGSGLGIAANLLFELPGQWLSGVLDQLLGPAPEGAERYGQDALRWVLHAQLAQLDEPVIQRYLHHGHGQPELRRFQLAQHLAGLYTQYLVYRRDWILAAEQDPSTHWQARLWHQVVQQLGPGHRAQRMDAVLRGPSQSASVQVDQPLHLFGINHLPPDLLELLQRLSRRLPVHLYVNDPAPQVYWHDQPSPRRQAREAAPEGHPLLAALGGLGQQLLRQLDQTQAQDHAPPEPEMDLQPLLARLQQGIRDVLPALVGPPLQADQQLAARHDASLRIHACHTPLRELEVLRDALLDLLAKHPQIHPRDIVVMAPDIRVYAPLIPAVFGAPGRDAQGQTRLLPWQLADRSVLSLHPLLAAVQQLLDLPLSRITQGAVLAALEVGALRRALGLDADGVDQVQRWLARSRVAWGLDAGMKAELGAAEQMSHSFEHAMDQLYLGLLSGGDETLAGFAGMSPLAGVADLQAPLLGALQTLLDLLAEARQQMAGHHSLHDWVFWLSSWSRRLLVADPMDSAETEALAALQAAIQAPLLQAPDLQQQMLAWPVLRAVLLEQLEVQPQRQPFGRGGITFCGMVPARVIPFEIVAVLGLNDGVFPRGGGDGGLNLIAQSARAGDRDARAEDRYLFLETLLSARSALHLSYVGQSPQDDAAANPASPLAELIEHLLLETGCAQTDVAPWFVRHALQPFAERYFLVPTQDPRLFSFSGQYAQPLAAQRPPRPPFVPAQLPAAPAAPALSLGQLLRFLRQPAAMMLREQHQLSLEVLEQQGSKDEEPLQAAFAALDQIDRKLFERARRQGLDQLDPHPPAWLASSGQMPSGLAGELAWAASAARVNAALQRLRQDWPQLLGAPPLRQSLQLELDGQVLSGSVLLLRHDNAMVLLETRLGVEASLPQLLPLFARYAALRLAHPQQKSEVLLLHGKSPDWHPLLQEWARLQLSELRQRLQSLVQLLLQAAQRPLLLFPRTIAAFVGETGDGSDHGKARQAWSGGFGQLGEGQYQPPYAELLARGRDFLDAGQPAAQEFEQLALQVSAAVLAPADPP